MAPYATPSLPRTWLDIATSFVPFLVLWGVMYAALDVSYWLVLLISIPAAGFLLRTFILFHDCTHGSLFHSRRANTWGGRIFGLATFQCFTNWRHHHAFHHGSAGDLDRRGTGDVSTWTVEEYYSKPFLSRLGYRLFRHPLVMFGIGPIWSLLIGPRVWAGSKPGKLRNSILLTNLAVVAMVGVAMAVFGWKEVLLIEAPLIVLAGTAGVWLFFVQHQFEDVYWESGENWSYADAALQGLELPEAAAAVPVLHRQHRPAPRPPPERARPQLQPAARPRRERGLPLGAGPHLPALAALLAAEALGRAREPPGHLRRGQGQHARGLGGGAPRPGHLRVAPA